MASKPKAVDTPNFSSILDTPASDVSRPKPVPQGTYVCMVKGLPRIDKSTKKGTEFSEYTLQIIEACEDVDSDALTECLTKASGDVIPIRDRFLRVTCYHTEDALWRLKKFLSDCGIEDEGSLREMMNQVPGRQVLAHVKHTPSDDGETMFANVDKTAPVGE